MSGPSEFNPPLQAWTYKLCPFSSKLPALHFFLASLLMIMIWLVPDSCTPLIQRCPCDAASLICICPKPVACCLVAAVHQSWLLCAVRLVGAPAFAISSLVYATERASSAAMRPLIHIVLARLSAGDQRPLCWACWALQHLITQWTPLAPEPWETEWATDDCKPADGSISPPYAQPPGSTALSWAPPLP